VPAEPKYRIQAVGEMTGIPTGTLRAWERRYGLPKPSRSGNRYRLYSDRDVAAVRALARLCSDGMAPSEAAAVVKARLERGEPPLDVSEPSGFPMTDGRSWGLVVDAIVEAALAFDTGYLDDVLRRVLLMGSATEIFDEALAPALRVIGDRWAAGTCGVGEEHFVSQTIDSVSRSMVKLAQPADARRRLLLACVADEQHEIGLAGVALRAAQRGWRTVCLGANTPPSALAQAIESSGGQVAEDITALPGFLSRANPAPLD